MTKYLPLRVLRADPAGNITLYVLDPVTPELRPTVTAHLLGISEFKAEQLAYCCPPIMGGQGRIEMAGGEFCGNATRAFAMVMQQEMGVPSPSSMRLEVSGCDHLVTAYSDCREGTAESEMPLPRSVRTVQIGSQSGVLVDLDGIAHLTVLPILSWRILSPAWNFSSQQSLFSSRFQSWRHTVSCSWTVPPAA